MSTVNGFQVGSETLKYNYESLENYNTPNFSSSSSKAYAIGDYVMYNGKLYKCTTATTGGTWVSGNWTEAVLSDDVSDLTRQLNDKTTGLDSKAPVILETASGAIASFDDGADGMPIKKLVATIEPVQAGSGDPSPDNVRPISGWTGAVLPHTGGNLYDVTSGRFLDFPFRAGMTIYAATTRREGFGLYFRHVDGTSPESLQLQANGVVTSITLTKDADSMVISDVTYQDLIAHGDNVMVSLLPFTNIVSYNGETKSINWQSEAGTVYGGTVTLNEDGSADVVVNTRIYTATSANSTVRTQDIRTVFSGVNWGHPSNISNKCKKISTSAFNAGQAGFIQPSDARTIGYWRLLPSSETTPEIVSSWLDGSVQFCMRLQTPQTYHFPNVGQLKSFLGQNNVWCDTGDVEVTYPADTKLFLTARDEEITGNIAPIENGTTASKAYAQGAYFWHDTKFCKVLTAIASGATFTLGTNYQETTVAAELLAAQN